jgi:ribosomal protein S1
VVSEGQEVLAEIISMDREERKIGLSLKNVGDEPTPTCAPTSSARARARRRSVMCSVTA